MRSLVRSIERADSDQFSMQWAIPHATTLHLNEGATLFRKGDAADAMYCLVRGRAKVVEFDVDLGGGEMIGEIGLFSRSGTRTATVICETDCELLALSYHTVRQLCVQNPQFGLHLVNIIARRLAANLERLEGSAARQRV